MPEKRFENEALGCKFALPDPFTLRHYEQYVAGKEEARKAGAISLMAVNWLGAVAVIDEWDCDAIPDMEIDPYDLTDEVFGIIGWVGAQVNAYVFQITAIPKN